MTEASALSVDPRPRRLYLDWVVPLLLRPRATLAQITAAGRSTWLTPLLVLTLTSLAAVAVAGPIRIAAAQSGAVQLPPDAQYWTPDQQAAFMQAQSATTGPVFVYVFPALLGVLGVWVGWLVLSGLLHLVLTLLGSRDTTSGALNLVAWASLPFAVRDVVRIAFMLIAKQLVNNPGLIGFAPSGQGWQYALAAELLSRADIYMLWFAVLLILGVRAGGGLPPRKAAMGVLLTLAIGLALQVLPGVILRQAGALQLVRPFFF